MTSAAALKTFTLSNGIKIPSIAAGFGTKWASRHRPEQKEDELDPGVIQGVKDAIAAGIYHIDGAEVYGTEGEIGVAISESGVKREDLYITTKIMKNVTDPIAALKTSLTKLKTDYVDLYLIHAPFFFDNLEEVWKGLETLHKEGKAKSIGVSNFKVEHLERILKVAEIKPVINQIEFHPYLQNQSPGIVEFSQKHGVLIEAYSPLGPIKEKGPLDPILEDLSKKYSKTPAQIIIRWTLQRNVLPVTASAKPDRLKEANEVFDFTLTEEEVSKITEVGNSHEKRFFWTDGKYF
ncbi:aldo-keto reductase superfamily protein [Sugiyamaella lignohabitans]|uniref:Aldo-keto reductase superfamily protein n=1 Tax=Sugiyamaella lignohabitans TaxID=796027 RepID=A0A167F202_9ASCO|nr:aldo-keto reductase superfamily protein [Sugiyamaella lignohabitans]ANB14723.1 aldo-keto reductase superfamily protein [Sugiyamaella lignohabitans]